MLIEIRRRYCRPELIIPSIVVGQDDSRDELKMIGYTRLILVSAQDNRLVSEEFVEYFNYC